MTPQPHDLYSPRKLRVVSGIQRCIKCDKPLFHTILQAGWAFEECQHRRCAQPWWSLAIPPKAPASHLAAIVGDDIAKIILAKGFPQSAPLEPPALWGFPLNPTAEQTWLQVAVRPRERHIHRTSRLTQLVTAFLL